MLDELTIHFKPLGGQTGSQVERACYADIGLAVGDHWLTLLEDRMASTVSNHLRASVHQLQPYPRSPGTLCRPCRKSCCCHEGGGRG